MYRTLQGHLTLLCVPPRDLELAVWELTSGQPGAWVVLPASSPHQGEVGGMTSYAGCLPTPSCPSPVSPSSRCHRGSKPELGVVLGCVASSSIRHSVGFSLKSALASPLLPASSPTRTSPSHRCLSPGCPTSPPKGSLPASCFSTVCPPHSSRQETGTFLPTPALPSALRTRTAHTFNWAN